jgi:hypothetical protein
MKQEAAADRQSERTKWIDGDELLTFNSCRILGESGKGSSGFIFYSMGRGIEEFEYAANITWLRKKSVYDDQNSAKNTYTMSGITLAV